jgi:hypothetical protein
MTEESVFALQPTTDTRAAQAASSGGADLPLTEGRIHPDKNRRDVCATRVLPGGVNQLLHGDIKSPLHGGVKSPPHRPWTLLPQGLAVFHGDKDTSRLSHYFLPRLLLEGKRVLMLDGANCADPRLLERLARQRRVPFEQFSRQIQIARAFTCFQLTELIARVPRLLTDFPAEVLIVTAFPELYYDEDVRDWNAQVAFEQALTNLQRWARSGDFTSPCGGGSAAGVSRLASHASAQVTVHQIERNLDKCGSADLKVNTTQGPVLALSVAVFSSATTFTPSPARRRFFERVCAAGSEVWQFNSNAEGKPRLVCTKRILGLPAPQR